MKMKKITILASALLLGSTLTLTSCGDVNVKDAEDVNFASYSNETTADGYKNAHEKYTAYIDLTGKDGYDFTTYNYKSTVIEGDVTTTVATSTKESSKYDKSNEAVRREYDYYAFSNEDSVVDDVEYKYTNVIQKSDKGIDSINEETKTYYSSEASLDNYITTSVKVSRYVDSLTGTVDPGDGTKQVKYYIDELGDANRTSVYTLKITIKTDDERTEGSIKLLETTSIETIFQFYVSETNVCGKQTTEKVVELEYTEGDKTGKVKKTEKTINYADLKIGAQSVSKVDLTNYTKEAIY